MSEDLAYVGGLMDGEGTITLTKSTRSKTGRSQITPLVQIANTDRPLLKFCEDVLGIKGCIKSQNRKNNKHKEGFVLVYQCKKAEAVVNVLLPYLRLKKPQAILLLEQRKLVKLGGRYTNGELEKIETLKEMIQKLNKRGPE